MIGDEMAGERMQTETEHKAAEQIDGRLDAKIIQNNAVEGDLKHRIYNFEVCD